MVLKELVLMNRSVFALPTIMLICLTLSCDKSSDQIDNANNVPINYTFIDPRDAKEYGILELGDQIWMDRNLDYAISTGNSAHYDNDSTMANSHGRLYDWQTALDAVPDGWHIPSSQEWEALISHCGGDSITGGKLKSEGFNDWLFPNIGASDEFKFNAIGTGQINFVGSQGIYEETYFWTSTEPKMVSELAYAYQLTQMSSAISATEKVKGIKLSVRCIRD